MFHYINGIVAEKLPNLAIIDCGGVGFEINTSAYTISQLKSGEKGKLYTHLYIREDCMDIYGFASKSEKRCFEMLIGVSGVGPKAAIAILSTGSPENLVMNIISGNEKALTAAPGVGKKIAQRIILELKDKMGGAGMEIDFSGGPAISAPVQQGGNVALARAALQELGYSPAEIQNALKGADPNATTEELVRHALRAMVMKG